MKGTYRDGRIYPLPETKEPRPYEEDDLYNSIYADVVRLVENDNIQCEYYIETIKKLKAKYKIERL